MWVSHTCFLKNRHKVRLGGRGFSVPGNQPGYAPSWMYDASKASGWASGEFVGITADYFPGYPRGPVAVQTNKHRYVAEGIF